MSAGELYSVEEPKGVNNDDLLLRIALSQVVEPGSPDSGRYAFLATTEDMLATAIDDRNRKARAAGRPCTSVTDALADAERELLWAARNNIQFVAAGMPSWPTQLDDLGVDAPLVLRVDGQCQLREIAVRSASVVGARAATRYGIHVAQEIATGLAGEQVTVVSGGAYGIDTAAHQGALAGDGATIAVSAAGLDAVVPLGNSGLWDRIRGSGVLVSEYPLGTRPARHRFLVRNRLIAALTPCTVVVEAAHRSGALSTARHAQQLLRVVAAVPGPVTSALSVGTHDVIRAGGAVLVTSAADVMELLPTAAQPDRPEASG